MVRLIAEKNSGDPELYSMILKNVGSFFHSSASDISSDWENLSRTLGYEGIRDPEFVDLLALTLDSPVNGIEVLFDETRDNRLYQYTDFAQANLDYSKRDLNGVNVEKLVYSYIYGGDKLRLYQKYCKGIFGLADMVAVGLAQIARDTTGFDVSYNRGLPGVLVLENGSETDKKAMEAVMKKLEKFFDFDIDEPRESDTWTIHVFRGTANNKIFDGLVNSLKDRLDSSNSIDGTVFEDDTLTIYRSDGFTFQVITDGSAYTAEGFTEAGDSIGSTKSTSEDDIFKFITE